MTKIVFSELVIDSYVVDYQFLYDNYLPFA